MTAYLGPLHEMTLTTPTTYWNDSCSVAELEYAIARGASGATSNPVILLNILKKEMHLWRDRILQIVTENPTWTETQVSWQIYAEIAQHGARLMLPVHERLQHKWGRLSIQTDPALYRNREAILDHVQSFAKLAPNIQVKMPATRAGIGMVEEATYAGVNLTVTVCFTVAQALAAAEAIERGLQRREAEGKPIASMSPVVALMIGRTDDWMKMVVKRDGIVIDPAYLEWCGVACFKKAYAIYQQRGYRTKLLTAAYRNFLHWTEFVGGDVILTIPWEWQVKFNESDVKPVSRMNEAVDDKILDALYSQIPDFRRAYDVAGLTVDEFDSFGATVRTLRSFIESWHNFVALIRDMMLPNPDVAEHK